jgi:hypothetical protein
MHASGMKREGATEIQSSCQSLRARMISKARSRERPGTTSPVRPRFGYSTSTAIPIASMPSTRAFAS